MPSSPLDPTRVAEANDRDSAFRRGLRQIDELIDSGVGLSGNERNCAFLNVPGPDGSRRFATASAVLGLDYPDDARAPAFVDWDRDGDLDLWITNRSGPLLRFLRNGSEAGNAWISLLLEGRTCNRDAIGARVVLHFESGLSMSQTLHAGEGYLGQSSKWLHFGLRESPPLRSIEVRWPGGEPESFEALEPGHRYHLVQGGEVRRALWCPAPLPRQTPAPPPVAESGAAHAVTASRWPLPLLPYHSFDGEARSAGGDRKSFQLIQLWATWCVPCKAELQAFTVQQKALDRAGIDVLALSVDGLPVGEGQSAPSEQDPRAFLEKLDFPFPAGLATEELIERVHSTAIELFGLRWPLPVPTSLLLDAKGQLIALYKGPVSPEKVLADAALSRKDFPAFHDGALPFAGRWFKRPEPLDPMPIPLALLRRDQAEDAYELVSRAKDRFAQNSEYPIMLVWIGDAFLKADKRHAEGFAAYRAALEADPECLPALNNLAWHLASHPNLALRDGAEAVRHAEAAAKRTKHEDPSVLDTLAAAYAEAGDFDRAVKTGSEALDAARRQGKADLEDGIRRALESYSARRRP